MVFSPWSRRRLLAGSNLSALGIEHDEETKQRSEEECVYAERGQRMMCVRRERVPFGPSG